MNFLVQPGLDSPETRRIRQWIMVEGNQIADRIVPVGTVEWVIEQGPKFGLMIPNENPDIRQYQSWLGRTIIQSPDVIFAMGIAGRHDLFVKPAKIKKFNGFILGMDTDQKNQEDYESYLNTENDLICSTPVNFLREYRVYIQNSKILGIGRYDSSDDEIPDEYDKIRSVAEEMIIHHDPLPSYALDLGVTDLDQILLVEITDAWAIGLYEGCLNYKSYAQFLYNRWYPL